ncbi:MAG TPA: arylamine N-acetyltransferase [Solirubrobacteraceae bacterium]|nr:arylamine N-acetyltransferase [Solirubrobacteraceae bacterium]
MPISDRDTFNFDAYAERIGVGGRPGLSEIHRAHIVAIPFENLDPHRGVPVSLEPEALHRKLIDERRGGYCFEHNLLLKVALETLGADVDLMLARVRVGAPPGTIRPRTHLVLRVRDDRGEWHADVGFGSGTLLEPIPFGPGDVHEQFGWQFRVVPDGDELVLQTADGAGWIDLYGFIPEPVPQIDVETSNWFTSTHPRSPFVTGLIVASHRADGTRLSLSDWSELAFVTQTPSGTSTSPVELESVPGLLESEFGLPGFSLSGAGRIVRG